MFPPDSMAALSDSVIPWRTPCAARVRPYTCPRLMGSHTSCCCTRSLPQKEVRDFTWCELDLFYICMMLFGCCASTRVYMISFSPSLPLSFSHSHVSPLFLSVVFTIQNTREVRHDGSRMPRDEDEEEEEEEHHHFVSSALSYSYRTKTNTKWDSSGSQIQVQAKFVQRRVVVAWTKRARL